MTRQFWWVTIGRRASFSPPRNSEDYIAGVTNRYGPFAESLLKRIPPAPAPSKTARDLARDSAFGWHTWIWARLQSRVGKSKAFYYHFDQHPVYPESSPRFGSGSPHGADVAYVFEHLNPSNPQITKADMDISEAMSSYWVNFAKHGDPNGEGLPAWPASATPTRSRDVLRPDTAHRPGAERRKPQESGRLFRLAADAGRRGLGKMRLTKIKDGRGANFGVAG